MRVKLEEKKLSSDFNEDFRQSHSSLARRISDINKEEVFNKKARFGQKKIVFISKDSIP